MAFEEKYRPLRKQVLIEPLHEKISTILIDPVVGKVKNVMMGRLIKLGADCEPMLEVDQEVVFVPHGGTIVSPKGDPERMVLPQDQIIGVMEKE